MLLPVYSDALQQAVPHAPSQPNPYLVPWSSPGDVPSPATPATPASSAPGSGGGSGAGGGGGGGNPLLRQALGARHQHHSLPDALLTDDLSPVSTIPSPASPVSPVHAQVGGWVGDGGSVCNVWRGGGLWVGWGGG